MLRYHRPATVADALAILVTAGDRARPLVGGTDLLVGLRHHTIEPERVVDLKGVADLAAPITVNICNASPAADTVPALLVYRAVVTITSVDGVRTVPLADFLLGPGRTRCHPGQLVTRVELPWPPARFGAAFQRLTRRRGVDLGTVSVAAGVSSDGRVMLGLGAVGPRPILVEAAEPVDLDAEPELVAVLERLLAVAAPITDVRASREYREAMLRVLARRAVLAAVARQPQEEVLS